MRVKIKDVRVDRRIRKSLGDLSHLKASLQEFGLLHPIIVDPDLKLIAGYRRLESARQLGWDTIEARFVDVKSRKERLQVEADENTTRRDFTDQELEHIHRLMRRYSKRGLLWRFINWFLDLLDRILP